MVVTLSLRDIVLLFLCLSQAKGFVKLCYFPNWAHDRTTEYTRFDVENIDPSLCTHLVYAFAQIDVDNRKIIPYNPNEESTAGLKGRYEKFNDLKERNTHLKTLVSIGGEYAGNEQFVAIAKDNSSLQTFANNVVDFLRQRNFDGLDIDWEYPNATTKGHFSRMIKTLRETFDAEHNRTGGERLLLTAAMPAGKHRIRDGYDMAHLNRYMDLVSLMTYDYHGGWNMVTSFDSPLLSRESNVQFSRELSTKWTVEYYLSLGLQASRLLVGITAAGTHFMLQHLNVTGVGAPVIRADSPRLSPKWQLPDRYAYPEICEVLQQADSERVFDEEQKVPYAFLDRDWFGYEDVQSIEGKADWMLEKGVAGAMFWALDMDDFTGQLCDNGTYPLLRALARRVGEEEGPPSTTTPGPNPTQGPGSTTTSQGSASGAVSFSRAGSPAAWILRLIAVFIVTVALRGLAGAPCPFGCR